MYLMAVSLHAARSLSSSVWSCLACPPHLCLRSTVLPLIHLHLPPLVWISDRLSLLLPTEFPALSVCGRQLGLVAAAIYTGEEKKNKQMGRCSLSFSGSSLFFFFVAWPLSLLGLFYIFSLSVSLVHLNFGAFSAKVWVLLQFFKFSKAKFSLNKPQTWLPTGRNSPFIYLVRGPDNTLS